MADRIYTFQQSEILQDIERLRDLFSTPDTPRRLKFRLFKALQRAVWDEPSIPQRLKAQPYFRSKRTAWDGRAMEDIIGAWLVELHRYLDDAHSTTASR